MAYIKPLTDGDAHASRRFARYYPQYIDPLYKNILSKGALGKEWSDSDYQYQRGNIMVIVTGERTSIYLGAKTKQPLIVEGNCLTRYSNGEVLVDKQYGKTLALERKTVSERKDKSSMRLTNRRILISVETDNIFIGSIEPQEGYGYYLPHCYQEGEVTINIGIICGRVIFRTMPEGLLAMVCDYNKGGKMMGVCSRFINKMSQVGPQPNERMGYDYNAPVFHSYYDKSGRSIRPTEYDDCLFVIIQQVTKLPTVLCGLLGYF